MWRNGGSHGVTVPAAICALLGGALAGEAPGQELLFELRGGGEGWRGLQQEFGRHAVAIGDLDGDGRPEIAIAAPAYTSRPGSDFFTGLVAVFSGADGSLLRQHQGPSRDSQLGRSLDGGRDLDGDGVADYVAGAPFDDSDVRNGGSVRAWSGATGAELRTFGEPRSEEALGIDVALLDDVDGDGRADVVAIAPWWSDGTSRGRAECWSGATGATIWNFTVDLQGDELSHCARLGDVNGDGVNDVALGSTRSPGSPTGAGVVRIVDGRDATLLRELVGERMGDDFGAVRGAGDVDADGIADLVVSAPGANQRHGRIQVFSGATGAELHRFDGTQRLEWPMDLALHAERDWNGDGCADVLYGSPWHDLDDCAGGIAELRSGRTGRLLFQFRSRLDLGLGQTLGSALGTVDDLDGDGVGDLVLGAQFAGEGVEGRAYVFAGDDLFLQADQSNYDLGDPLTLELRGGASGVLGMIVVSEIDGVPMAEPIAFAPLDAFGELLFHDAVDSAYLGHSVRLHGYCQQPSGHGALDSNEEWFRF